MPLRCVIVIDYEGNPLDYGTDDPVKMAYLDYEQFADPEIGFGPWFDGNQLRVAVVPR